MSKKITHLNSLLRGTGLAVHTYSPGDGITRYRFGFGDSYFTMEREATVLGFAQAEAFAMGVACGQFIKA